MKIGADPAFVASQSNPQAVSTEGFNPGDWQPIATAPFHTPVRIRTEGGREFDAIETNGVVDDNGEDCSAWSAVRDWEAPDCWSDGVCWWTNDSGVKSDQPTHWQPLATQSTGDNQ